jgi:hypothetical protein
MDLAKARGEKIFSTNSVADLRHGFTFFVQNGTHLPLTGFNGFDSIR